jgi:NAD(P)-dependent dehydrogenase (short-subunit alcohol dehydrogenase family)
LKEKVVIIGAGSGMGRSIARLASEAGARVVLAGRTRAKLELAASDIGTGATVEVVDTTSESSVELFFQAMGAIEHLAIPGSAIRTGSLKEASIEDGLYSMQSKFWGPYLCAKHARFNEGGSMPEADRAAMYQAVGTKLPVGKVGSPDEIASAVLMLMENAFITGVVLDVDGGGLLV